MNIVSNGSRWTRTQPASIGDLMLMLENHVLDPRFEACGNFVIDLTDDPAARDGETLQIWGNFFNISHVFDIRGTDEELRPLVHAIRRNQATDAYIQAKRESTKAQKD